VSTSDRILDAAEKEFARKGFEATSLADIADVVRIRVPSLYKHFDSKRALFLAVLQRLLDPYVELLHKVLTVPRDAEGASDNLLLVMRHYLETPNLARLVQHAALAGGVPLRLLVDRWYRPLFQRAAEMSGGTASVGDPAVAVVVAFHSMMSGYVTMAGLHERLIGGDPLGDPAVAAQLVLMRRLAALLWQAR
jgi:TetR/AcrR family transcriptional regulator